MAHQLWLKVPRQVVKERGYGITHVPGDVRERLSGTGWEIDPATGFLCPRVNVSWEDALSWEAEDETTAVSPFMNADGSYATGFTHTGTGDFELATTTSLSVGSGFFLGVINYEISHPFSVDFGGRWRVTIDNGAAELFFDQKSVASAVMYDTEEWKLGRHTLYVYNIGSLVVVRRTHQDRTRLVSYRDPGQDDGYALREGPVTIKGTGRIAALVAPERHATNLSATHSQIKLPEQITTGVESVIRYLAPPDATPAEEPNTNAPTLTVVGPDGDEITTGESGQFGYTINATLHSDTTPNLYVSRVRVWFPKEMGPDGLTGVDLLTLPGVAVQRVEDRRALDPESCGLGFELVSGLDVIAPYVQPNMRGSWRPGGSQRADFLTTEPALEHLGTYERLSFSCELGWKRFKDALWAGESSFGGQRLADAYAAAAARAGLETSDIEVYAGGYTLPAEPDDGPPVMDFRPGQPVSEVLAYLRDSFGSADVLRFRPDGKFYAEEPQTAHSGVTFYWTTPAASETGSSGVLRPVHYHVAHHTSTYPRVRAWSERLTEQGFANEVWVVGADKEGRALLSWATDWPSVNDPNATNYWGGFKRLVIVDGGLVTQPLVNWVCRQVYSRVRVLQRFAVMQALYLPALLEGEIITVDGRGDWRILSMTTTWDRSGPSGLAAYDLEAVV